MADSEQIQAVLDEADFQGQRLMRVASATPYVAIDSALAASVVVELQRIADSLEIMVSQGRHL